MRPARVAREVHDEPGQTLTGLKIDLSWLEKRLPGETEEVAGSTKAMLRLVERDDSIREGYVQRDRDESSKPHVS